MAHEGADATQLPPKLKWRRRAGRLSGVWCPREVLGGWGAVMRSMVLLWMRSRSSRRSESWI